jgi:hypothetical protein
VNSKEDSVRRLGVTVWSKDGMECGSIEWEVTMAQYVSLAVGCMGVVECIEPMQLIHDTLRRF